MDKKKFFLCMGLLLCLFPKFMFSENGWIPEELEDSMNSFYGESRKLELEFETTVEVSAECTYPYLFGNSPLINYANKKLEAIAKDLFENFVEVEKTSEEEYDGDFGGCYLGSQFFPVYCLPNLISVYGFECRSRACPHGWTHYEGKNFWQNGETIVELKLEDLFLQESDWCSFLIQYCDEYFKSTRHGYYGTDNWFTPELEKKDLDVFVLTERGVMIIFRSYKVGGWADGPDVITIPYDKLKAFIDPKGPLREVLGLSSILFG